MNWRGAFTHLILISEAIFMSRPVCVAFMSSTHSAERLFREGLKFWPGGEFFSTYHELLFVEGGVIKIEHGEIIVFVGPSGCGRSKLLR
jgi:sn-glycerol 3-phosphate transport system permease protein